MLEPKKDESLTDDNEDRSTEMARVLADMRKIGGFRFTSRRGKALSEHWDAENSLRALGLSFTNFRHRGDEDPPDCEAIVAEELWGIECTELADPSTHERIWTRADFLDALQKILARKDHPHDLKGGPYHRYLLVVWTRELHLTRESLEAFLTDALFSCSLISDACIALDYHPGLADEDPQRYPVVKIPIDRRRP